MEDQPKFDKVEYMEGLKTYLDEVFADYVVIGIDLMSEVGTVLNVGIKEVESESNRSRINRMVGELEEAKLKLQLGGIGFEFDNDDEEFDDEEEPDEPWKN